MLTLNFIAVLCSTYMVPHQAGVVAWKVAYWFTWWVLVSYLLDRQAWTPSGRKALGYSVFWEAQLAAACLVPAWFFVYSVVALGLD